MPTLRFGNQAYWKADIVSLSFKEQIRSRCTQAGSADARRDREGANRKAQTPQSQAQRALLIPYTTLLL
jgi:hypothetical protein